MCWITIGRPFSATPAGMAGVNALPPTLVTQAHPPAVDDPRPLLRHVQGAFDGGGGPEEAATVRERVGRDVQDTHDDRAAAEIERPIPEPQDSMPGGVTRQAPPPPAPRRPRRLAPGRPAGELLEGAAVAAEQDDPPPA